MTRFVTNKTKPSKVTPIVNNSRPLPTNFFGVGGYISFLWISYSTFIKGHFSGVSPAPAVRTMKYPGIHALHENIDWSDEAFFF